MAHGLERLLTDPAVALRRQAEPLKPVFEQSLRTARAILRQLPLLGLAAVLSVIYLCLRGVRGGFALYRRLAARPPVERAAGLAVVAGMAAAALWLAPPGATGPAREPVHAGPGHGVAAVVREHREPVPGATGAVLHDSHDTAPAGHAEAAEEENKAAAEGVTVTVTLAEAVAHQLGESLSFFELGGKINEIFTPLKKGDTTTAMSKGAGAVTEYSLAALLVDSLEIMAMIASGVAAEAALGVAGSVAIVRSAVFIGEKVEETTHHSLGGHPETGHPPASGRAPASGHAEQMAQD